MSFYSDMSKVGILPHEAAGRDGAKFVFKGYDLSVEFDVAFDPEHTEHYSVRVRLFSGGDKREPVHVQGSGDTFYVSAGQLPDVMRLVRDDQLRVLLECLRYGG